jgi:cytoskeletal protein RodZ
MADLTPGDFGRMLREARERRGISLRELSNTTKISVTVLEELERNDISHLPGGIFGRGFVRSYAEGVGLEPEAVIQAFIARFPHESVTAGHPASTQHDDNERIESERRTARTFARLVALSVPLAAAVVYFTSGRHSVAPPSPVAASVPAPTPLSASPSAQPTSSAPLADPAVPAADATQAIGPLSVAVAAVRPSHVTAVVDGVTVLDEPLAAGDRRVLSVGRALLLTADDGAAVTMTMNGADAHPLGPAGKAITVRVDAATYRDALSGR